MITTIIYKYLCLKIFRSKWLKKCESATDDFFEYGQFHDFCPSIDLKWWKFK